MQIAFAKTTFTPVTSTQPASSRIRTAQTTPLTTASTLPTLLALACLFSLLFSFSAAAAPAVAPDGRPNIILVLSDDQRFDAFGAMTPGLHTPSMDKLAREGLHFKNMFVTTSLCSPSRASIISGLSMRNHGVVDNNSPVPDDLEPFPLHLQNAGYDTAFIGKWHMGHDDASPKPGFDRWVSFEGQGTYGPTDAFGRPSLFNVDGRDVPQRGYITDELTDYALDWLKQREAAPFFLYLSHKAAHLPFSPSARHRDQYRNLALQMPASADPAARRGPVPMWLSKQRNSWSGVDFTYYSSRSLHDFQRDYYAALSAVDDSVGALLQWIDAAALQRDTVVIFTSDNGFMFGEHGLIDKRAAYEASMRVPLMIHSPRRFGPGRAIDAIARNIDLAPTILELAGLPAPAHYDGRSVLPAAGGDGAAEAGEVVYEYYWEFNYPQTPSTFALRTSRYKYIQYHGVWDTEELFDLQNDPAELHNLIQEPAHQARKVDMRARLYRALSTAAKRPSIPFTSRYNQGAVFWTPEKNAATTFSPHWSRRSGDADLYEHLIADGPEKKRTLETISPNVKRILDPAKTAAEKRKDEAGEGSR